MAFGHGIFMLGTLKLRMTAFTWPHGTGSALDAWKGNE
jgi:hypothetical protein